MKLTEGLGLVNILFSFALFSYVPFFSFVLFFFS